MDWKIELKEKDRIRFSFLDDETFSKMHFGIVESVDDGLLIKGDDGELYYINSKNESNFLFQRVSNQVIYERRERKCAQSGILLEVLKTQYPWIYEHSLRVRDLSLKFAKLYGLPSEQLFDLSTAALLHDVGKLMIPYQIINKPDKLTTSEMFEMKKHSDYGCQILNGLGYPDSLCKTVYEHHERCDGNGYHKLKCPSLEARIIQTADAYDAMTHERPYAARKTADEVRVVLEQERGKQFWPEMADIAITYIGTQLI